MQQDGYTMNNTDFPKYLTEEFELPFDQLTVRVEKVVKAIGYPENAAPKEIIDMVRELLDRSSQYVNVKCGYVWLTSEDIDGDGEHLYLDDVTFHTKRIVGVPLRKMSEAVLFVGTIGGEFDKWSKETFDSGDPLFGYIIDSIGSELAESMADWLEKKIIAQANKEGKKCSNRYSPGYCGWDVYEQHKLFNFLPKDFCGISLSETALMRPQKSVSGIIGVSESMKRMEYPCDVCRVPHCYKNRELV
jgi:hypothetical protein